MRARSRHTFGAPSSISPKSTGGKSATNDATERRTCFGGRSFGLAPRRRIARRRVASIGTPALPTARRDRAAVLRGPLGERDRPRPGLADRNGEVLRIARLGAGEEGDDQR